MTEEMKEACDRLNMSMKSALVTFANELDITEMERKGWQECTAQLKVKEQEKLTELKVKELELAQREKDVKNREDNVSSLGKVAADRLVQLKVAQESAAASNAKAKKAEKERDEAQAEKVRLEAVVVTALKDKADLVTRVAELTRTCAELECQAVMGGPV